MGSGFYQLPAYRAGQALDLEPVNNALTALSNSKWRQQQADSQMQQSNFENALATKREGREQTKFTNALTDRAWQVPLERQKLTQDVAQDATTFQNQQDDRSWQTPQKRQAGDLGLELTRANIDATNAQAAARNAKASASPAGNVPVAVRTQAIKAKQAYDVLGPELDKYEQLVAGRQMPNGKTDPQNPGTGASYLPGEENDAIGRSRRNIQLQLKELFNLGVLNGPDLGLMNEMVVDPNVNLANPFSYSNGYDVPNRTRKGITDLKEKLRNMRNAQTNVAGIPDAPPQGNPKFTGPPLPQERPVQITSDAEHAQLPPGTQYMAPDGQLRIKR